MAAVAAATCVVPAQFSGLRAVAPARSQVSFQAKTKFAVAKSRTTCEALPTSLVISLSTGTLLFLGRFAFLPFQKAQLEKQGLPVQNGVSHSEAGDSRAVEVPFLTKSNDPAGFSLTDVLAWGALGHAIGFFILATASNGYEPTF
eukprot:TRINITY_DN2661_c0_g1_i1.p1 TRINITY_DN2661_c0_g1~~TRINITY_DN2661_c0_g1_i1.p1  ORF type:complete len:145 (+),score=20.13 TRINITY_DN2661_c0_g1_i1:205-639(+)